jgi:hypothetical protein
MKGTWQTTDSGGSGLMVPLAVGAAVLAVLIAGPVAAAVGAVAEALVITIAVLGGLAVLGGAAFVVYRLRHGQPRTLPPGVIHARPVPPAVQGRSEPRALPARPEIHVHHHWHGVSAEGLSAILARVTHDDHGRGG